MTPQRGDGLDVGLDACAAGRVKTGKYQNLWAVIEFDGAAP
ncbi:hypothetical protein [Marinobacter nitratireducens]|nr:hypothetical protein [Marinobacter nitratireducens]